MVITLTCAGLNLSAQQPLWTKGQLIDKRRQAVIALAQSRNLRPEPIGEHRVISNRP